MNARRPQTAETDRRQTIVQAARDCFLQFGYAKTSLDDIAKRANVSRPLIYVHFKNKAELFVAVFEALFAGRYAAVAQVLASEGHPREQLRQVYEILLLEPWDILIQAPMASEFYETCERLFPDVEAQYERHRSQYTEQIIGDPEVTELFLLAVDGLQSDFPPTATLRRRIQLLIDRFVA